MIDELWGWSWAELESLARRAASQAKSVYLNWDDRVQAAMDGICDCFPAGSRPLRGDLLAAALDEISAQTYREKQTHGFQADPQWNGQVTRQRFVMFWRGTTTRTDRAAPFEEPILEKIAAREVFWSLRDADRDVLHVVSWYSDYGDAAEHFGISHTALVNRLWNARRRAREAWFDWESDPGHYARRGQRGPAYELAKTLRVKRSRQRAEKRDAA